MPIHELDLKREALVGVAELLTRELKEAVGRVNCALGRIRAVDFELARAWLPTEDLKEGVVVRTEARRGVR